MDQNTSPVATFLVLQVNFHKREGEPAMHDMSQTTSSTFNPKKRPQAMDP